MLACRREGHSLLTSRDILSVSMLGMAACIPSSCEEVKICILPAKLQKQVMSMCSGILNKLSQLTFYHHNVMGRVKVGTKWKMYTETCMFLSFHILQESTKTCTISFCKQNSTGKKNLLQSPKAPLSLSLFLLPKSLSSPGE